MGSINTDSTTINFNGANIKIATSGKGLIFADGTTLSSNTEIGGGGSGSSNLAQVVNLGNATSNTMILENTDKTIVSSGNIESNIITTIIRFQEGSELPDGQGITLENAANNGNTISNIVQFSNGFTVGSNLVVDEIGTNVIDVTGRIGATLFVGDGGLLSNISGGGGGGGGGGGSHTLQSVTENGSTTTEVVTFTNGLVASSISGLDTLSFTSTNTTTPPLQLTASSLNDGVGALRIDSVEPDIYLNDTDGGFATVTFADNDVQRCAFGRNSGNDFYLTVRDPSTNSGNWRNDTFVADSSTGDISMGYDLSVSGNVGIGTTSPSANLHVVGNVHASSEITSGGNLVLGTGSDQTIVRTNGTIELAKSDGGALIDFKNSTSEDYDFRIMHTTYGSGKLFFTSANAGRSFVFDGQYGAFGLHTSNPEGRLHIKQATDDNGGDLDYYSYAAINIESASTTNRWSAAMPTNVYHLYWYYNKNRKFLMRSSGTDDVYLNFTGQHRCFNEFSNASNLVGMIVCSKSNKYVNFDFNQSPTINECLPVITLSNVAYDKSCFGVISGKEESGNRTTSSGTITTFLEQESGDNRVFVNSLGEGAIWVSNLNGNLESGDYITTSNIAGYGQKQDSEFLANYTVAKITMDCNFNPQMVPKRVIKKDQDGNNVLDSNGNLILEDSDELITQYEVKTLEDGTKVAFVGCTYHCG